MSNLTESNECAALVENFKRALAEMPSEPADRFWSDRDVFMKMVGGTKENAKRIAEKNQFCPESSGPFRSGHTDRFHQFFNK